ncbi:rRNA maturation RNase YbeY [Phaeobacter inhibens]|uniref:rRNA maturation RNase YbeY n=1 Tax=Phaeobacter inhibens TaxID=221822 RepID=UPI0021A28056|nr:rRNA maturation RNase YbeY [Phaeobacter inhibens]UWR53458.1 rRNA maturation RNase YbeY [Phaeobacter inhibens]UWR57405.1 rRNA maturation RNase YbeY [Phaeobacter inhibens]UWR69020.1 rRNA maturation RNase YbeY [Phaeobacter inhibens]UWR72948.1 rRNA maturation RNase YbeY [Phaeobacter inhibens]UWR80765.1 rRNA maturation RNase YbeY [Phaeobacter inhibens]
MTLDISIDDTRWQDADLTTHAVQAIHAVLGHFGLDADDCELSLLACDDARIMELNTEFRQKAKPTNVLSWPAEDLSSEEAGDEPLPPEADFTGEIPLGDIAIAYETCAREAEDAGKSLADHLRHLIVHGVLHLLGYDHIRDPDATLMERLEVQILGKMGIDDPYTLDDSPNQGRIG